MDASGENRFLSGMTHKDIQPFKCMPTKNRVPGGKPFRYSENM